MEASENHSYDQLLAEKVRLEQLNQVKDKLLHMIGHDLRSPLGSIKMILDFIDQETIDPQSLDFKTMLPELLDAADEAFYLLENLLYWTRIQTNRISYNPENLSAKQLVDKSITNMNRAFQQKGIKITNQINGDEQVFGDEYLLPVIFRNLLSNACKFSKEGSEVTISLSESPGQMIIRVCDQGIGIKEENLQKIRAPYTLFSTYGTNNETGTGLGLKVCEALAGINQGQLLIESQEEGGTTVDLILPYGKKD